MRQSWEHLLFAHWPVPAEALRPMIPAGLELDLFDSTAWLGIVPFQITGFRLRGLPPVPTMGAFPELNVRTYVTCRERGQPRPGVWFFSLDAPSRLAVAGARALYRLPYFLADMSCRAEEGAAVDFKTARRHQPAGLAQFRGRYRPAEVGISYVRSRFDDWVAERYRLYTANRRGRLYVCDIHHPPWPLQPAEAGFEINTMAEAAGIRLPDVPPTLHFARAIDVLIWPLRRLA